MTTIQKTPLILEGPGDWEEWYKVIRTTAQNRGIGSLVNIDVVTAPISLLEPIEPTFNAVQVDATLFSSLNREEKEDYKALMAAYRLQLQRFDKQEKALHEIFDLILNSLARNLRTYIRGLNTPYEMLKALKKRLAPTDRARRLELAREYQALKKAPKGQGLDKWLMQWETTYADAEKLQLAKIQDNKALYDFIMAIKSVDPAYASAYQVYVDVKLEEEGTGIPTLYDAVEKFRNNLRLNQSTVKSYTHTAFATFQGEEDSEPADASVTALRP